MATRDRDARLAATIARGAGLTRPVAALVVRQLPAVTRLLERDDATVRHVLDDAGLRERVAVEVRDQFPAGWQRATLAALRDDHDVWLRGWWWPACTDVEVARLRGAAALRPAHHRVAWPPAALPASTGAAEVLLKDRDLRQRGGYLVVDRRIADALRRLADDLGADVAAASPAGDVDAPPPGVDPDAVTDVGWWHA